MSVQTQAGQQGLGSWMWLLHQLSSMFLLVTIRFGVSKQEPRLSSKNGGAFLEKQQLSPSRVVLP